MSPLPLPSFSISPLLSGLDLSIGIDWGLIHPAYIPALIFFLRTLNLTLSTIRMLLVFRGRKLSAWILAIIQNLLYIISVAGLLSDLQNPLTLLAYAGGFATGTVLGMALEQRLAIGYSQMQIISSSSGPALVEAIRNAGFAATELPARGRDGTVSVISCSLRRRDIPRLTQEVETIDAQAFITAEDIRALQRGYWRH
jgi:uncharacterized protein YebE (UPF0316 family)